MAGKLVQAVRRRGQRGMTTAEYAVGSVAVATGIGTLISIFQQEWFREILKQIVELIFKLITDVLGG